MPSSTSHADPFTDRALRPTTSNATSLPDAQLRHRTSQASLRSGAGSAASHRARQTRELYAPDLSRRPPSRVLHRRDDAVLADSDSERDIIPTSSGTRQPRLRRVRRISPDSKPSKTKHRQEEEMDIVHRQADGSFLPMIPGQTEALQAHLMSPELQEEAKMKEVDDEYIKVARQFFTTGASIKSSRTADNEHEYDEFLVPMLAHLRAQVLEKLDDERWRFESTAP